MILYQRLKETNLNEFEELKDSIDNINSKANKIIKNSEEKNQEKFDNNQFC